MHGFGLFRWATGRVYIGDWASDLKEGVGILTFKGGNEYSGEFRNDRRQGYGYYQWADNRKFKGWWHENKQHGLGVYFSPEQTAAKFGVWQMGKRIKWLSEAECSDIRNGKVDYINYFSPQNLQPNEKDRQLSREQLQAKYRGIDYNRLQTLKESGQQPQAQILFHCPIKIEKKLEVLRKRLAEEESN